MSKRGQRDVSPNTRSGGANQQRRRPQKMEERTLGASRDLTQQFYLKKQQAMNGGIDSQKERFKPKSNILQNPLSKSGDLQQHFQNDSSANQYSTGGPTRDEQNSNQKLDSQVKFQQNNWDYEQQVQQNLPPVWIDLQEDVDDNLIQIKHLMEELRPLKAQRFGGAIFDEAGARRLDENISQLVLKITKMLKQSEEKVKSMASAEALAADENEQFETSAESNSIKKLNVSRVKKEIIQNVQQTYRQKLRVYAQELKSVEKEYLDKMVEMDANKEQGLTVEQLQKQIVENSKKYDEEDMDLAHRNEKIPQIIAQMNDLAELYKEMSKLVIEQGTVMDRIDQNVFEARFQVSEGKDKIADTLKSDTSPRAQACIVCLVQCIVVCVIFLALKHT